MKIQAAGFTAGGDAKELELELPEGSTAGEAAAQAQQLGAFAEGGEGSLAVWGRRVEPERPLREGDRLEITLPLVISPNEGRKLRARRALEVQKLSQGRHGGRHRLG